VRYLDLGDQAPRFHIPTLLIMFFGFRISYRSPLLSFVYLKASKLWEGTRLDLPKETCVCVVCLHILLALKKDHLTGNQSFVNRTHGDVEMYVCFNLVWVRGRRNDGIGRTKAG